jgi:hypothetical protein
MAAPGSDRKIVVQGLWVGSRLSALERLSVSSFLAHGQEYHLYVYGHVDNIPPGTTVKDGNEILPSSWLFRDSRGSFSGFSNFFRYKLLFGFGGWWVDTDMVCLKPFDFNSDYLFANEPDQTIGSAVIRVPPGSEVMARAWAVCAAMDRAAVEWGASGPSLLIRLVHELGLEGLAVEPKVFFPFDWEDWQKALDPTVKWEFDPVTRSIHLWSAMWSLSQQNPDATYPPDCLYEKLKRKYLA